MRYFKQLKMKKLFLHSTYLLAFFFIILVNTTYAQVSEAEKAKKETRTLLISINNLEVAGKAAASKDTTIELNIT